MRRCDTVPSFRVEGLRAANGAHWRSRIRRARRLALVVLALGASPALAVTAMGTEGPDKLVGSAGDDSLYGRAGNDTLLGEGGDDALDGGPGADVLVGGQGTEDAATYGTSGGVVVTLDGRSDDGAPGEGDNVRRDVEHVYGGPGDDRLTGSNSRNTLDGASGDDHLRGGRGDDSLFGAQGNDILEARDRVGDEVDCGSGRDVAVADREDRTASCEWVVDALPAGPFVLVKVDQRFGAPKGVPRSKACRGTMRLDLFRGRDRVARATVRVDRTCRYARRSRSRSAGWEAPSGSDSRRSSRATPPSRRACRSSGGRASNDWTECRGARRMPDTAKTVGRYEILGEIGSGGMALVHLARQADIDRLVALKELDRLHASDPAFAQRFLRESQLAGGLAHPNIVTVFDYFEWEGTPYIAMEYLERGSLRPLLGLMTLAQAGACSRACSGASHTRSAAASCTATSSPRTCWSRRGPASRSPIRNREGDDAGRDEALDGHGNDAGHARLHGAGAGDGRGARALDGSLLRGLHGVRDGRRSPAVPRLGDADGDAPAAHQRADPGGEQRRPRRGSRDLGLDRLAAPEGAERSSAERARCVGPPGGDPDRAHGAALAA